MLRGNSNRTAACCLRTSRFRNRKNNLRIRICRPHVRVGSDFQIDRSRQILHSLHVAVHHLAATAPADSQRLSLVYCEWRESSKPLLQPTAAALDPQGGGAHGSRGLTLPSSIDPSGWLGGASCNLNCRVTSWTLHQRTHTHTKRITRCKCAVHPTGSHTAMRFFVNVSIMMIFRRFNPMPRTRLY
jgi:hypothetical protein